MEALRQRDQRGPGPRAIPRKKKPPPQTYEEYAGFSSREMRQRAMDAGCRTIFDMLDWLDKHYGDCPEREQNRSLPPPPYRRPAKP